MITSLLIYGLVICALIQPDAKGQRLAAWVMVIGLVGTDYIHHLGLIEGHGYYLFCAAMAVVIASALCYSDADKLVGKLHNACIAAFVLNAVDWVLYTHTAIINDLLYEGLFIALYMYVWVALLGKGGANVVGRIHAYGNARRHFGTNSRVHASNSHRNEASK